MQGQRSSLTTLPENLNFDHAAMSGETGIESQMSWSNIQASAHNQIPEYRLSTSGPSVQARRVRLGGPSSQWSLGEGSSTAAQNHVHGNEVKIEQHSRNLHSRAGLTMVERQYEPVNVISLDNDEVDLNGNLSTTGSFVLRNSSSDAISQDLNMISSFGDDDEDDDCQIVEPPSTYASVGSSTVLRNEDRPGCSSDGRRTSCKRKAFEAQVGLSSGVGNLNSFQDADRCHGEGIEVGPSSGAGNSDSLQNAKRCHWVPIPGNAVKVQAGPSSGAGNSNSSQNTERSHWAPVPGKAVEVRPSSAAGNSNSSQNDARCQWGPIPGKAVQVEPSSGAGNLTSLQNAERCQWVPVPGKEFEVGPSSGAGNSTSSQNDKRYQWVPVHGKAVQVGQSSGTGNSNSVQNAERCQWVPIPRKEFEVGPSSGAGNSNSSQNAERYQWVPIPRKEFEVGPSSGAGNSNSLQHAEGFQWVPIPADHIASSNVTQPTQNEPVFTNLSERSNPRLRLGVGGAVSAGPFSLTSSGNPESSRRNFRVRINGSPYRDPIVSHTSATEAGVGNRDIPLTRHAARLLRNNVLDLNPVPPVENSGGPHEQYTASARRHPQTRCSRASSSRNTRSSTPAIPEPTATNIPIPRSISEHPIFVPASTETGSLSEHSTGWNVASGNNTTAGNVVSASAAGSSSGVNLSAAAWSHRNRPERPRRLSEIVRRSVLLSAGSDSGSQGLSPAIGSSSSLTPEEMALLSGSSLHDRAATSARAALERNIDLPYTLRSLATASEGRSSIMTEIRHVLNLMRRGEGLRFEDVMLLDHSVFLGMADMHDRHRDMRLDVDNMSYEELLALEERIGNVCTGLNDETIKNGLKQRKYVENGSKDQVDTEPCSICREEYNDGEDLGTLECGHDFHRDCIKQWLVQKNSCPICKKTGLST